MEADLRTDRVGMKARRRARRRELRREGHRLRHLRCRRDVEVEVSRLAAQLAS